MQSKSNWLSRFLEKKLIITHMKNYKKYQVVLTYTDPYIASRHGDNDTVKHESYDLKDCYRYLLQLYNSLFDDRPYATNWGSAVLASNRYIDGAQKTDSEGMRAIYYDSRIYQIEEVEEAE